MSEHNLPDAGQGQSHVRPEWAERLRIDDQFPGRTFTADQMDRIERRALSGAGGRRGLWLRLSAAGSIACVIAFAVWLVVAGPLAGDGEIDGMRVANTPGPVPTASSMPSQTSLPAETPTPSATTDATVFVKGAVQALIDPQPFVSNAPFVALPNEAYRLGETSGNYVQISYLNDIEIAGWIPSWYLVKSGENDPGDRIEQLEQPYEMIVDKPVKYRIYPGEIEPSGFELWEGKVVQVVAKYADWLEINVVTYDSPYVENKWVRQDELIPYEASKAKEGYVQVQGATLYDEQGNKTENIPGLTNVYIEGELGDRYRVTASGGRSGYMDKSAFVPNPIPFSLTIVDQSGDTGAAQ
jgi:hypothetical protein